MHAHQVEVDVLVGFVRRIKWMLLLLLLDFVQIEMMMVPFPLILMPCLRMPTLYWALLSLGFLILCAALVQFLLGSPANVATKLP